MERIGVAFAGGGMTPPEIVECVQLAEELGYESAWVAEGHGGDQFSILTACALADFADTSGHQHQQRLRPERSHHRHGGRVRGSFFQRPLHPRLGQQPQGAGRSPNTGWSFPAPSPGCGTRWTSSAGCCATAR